MTEREAINILEPIMRASLDSSIGAEPRPIFYALQMAIKALDNEPKQGRNIARHPSLFECSVCHWQDGDTYTGDTETYNYCPNCGAVMKGEEE